MRMRKWLLRFILIMGLSCIVATYYIYRLPETASYEEAVKRAIAGVLLSITGGILVVIYIWKR